MNTIRFDELDSYRDLHLILESKTIAAPSPKTATTDIPGGDGVLDFTEYFGEVNYNNRKLTFEFSTIVPKKYFLELFSRVQNKLHGKRMKIVLSDDPEFYYYGRVTINEWKSNKRIGKMTIEVDAEPYKYKQVMTVISDVLTSTKNIVCFNLNKAVVPKITVEGRAVIKLGGYSVATEDESITDDNIAFTQGENVLTVSPEQGQVIITIEYQERGL